MCQVPRGEVIANLPEVYTVWSVGEWQPGMVRTASFQCYNRGLGHQHRLRRGQPHAVLRPAHSCMHIHACLHYALRFGCSRTECILSIFSDLAVGSLRLHLLREGKAGMPCMSMQEPLHLQVESLTILDTTQAVLEFLETQVLLVRSPVCCSAHVRKVMLGRSHSTQFLDVIGKVQAPPIEFCPLLQVSLESHLSAAVGSRSPSFRVSLGFSIMQMP